MPPYIREGNEVIENGGKIPRKGREEDLGRLSSLAHPGGASLVSGGTFPVYTLTLGYFGFMWLADLFRIPKMVRKYNTYIYQRATARGLAGNSRKGGEVIGGDTSFSSSLEGTESVSEKSLPQDSSAAVHTGPEGSSGTTPPTPQPSRRINPLIIGIAAGVLVLIAVIVSLASSGDKSDREETSTSAQTTTASGEESVQKLGVTVTAPSTPTVSNPNITLEGITEPGAWVTVKGCANAPVYVQAGSDGKFSAALTLSEGLNFLSVGAEKDGKKGTTTLSVTYQIDEATYKAQCRPMEFRVLNKNPDAYKGQKYFAMGQVVQIMEGYGSTDIRLNVTRDQWGYWDDTIYVTYSGSVPAYEDSIIKIWGEIQGSYTYTSTAGWNITLPLVKAKYIEVVQQ